MQLYLGVLGSISDDRDYADCYLVRDPGSRSGLNHLDSTLKKPQLVICTHRLCQT